MQVECLPAAEGGKTPVVKTIEGVVVHSASEPAGEFECSNPLFNRIRKLVRWAQRSNLMSVLTDCPHRERLGWLEQDHLNGPALRYEFDLAQFFTKTMNDMADSQLANGLVPTTAPEYTIFRDRATRTICAGYSAIRRNGAAPSCSCPGSNTSSTATSTCSAATTTA